MERLNLCECHSFRKLQDLVHPYRSMRHSHEFQRVESIEHTSGQGSQLVVFKIPGCGGGSKKTAIQPKVSLADIVSAFGYSRFEFSGDCCLT